MTDGEEQFSTRIRNTEGYWPSAPAIWSYSSLRDAEECPLRWAFARATYPTVWNGRGYPRQLVVPAVVGDIVHRCLDLILRALHEHGCESIQDPEAVVVLRKLGGYSSVIETEIEREVEQLEANPRIAPRISTVQAALGSRVPEIRQRVQVFISKAHLVRHTVDASQGTTPEPSARVPLTDGSHPEVWLEVSQLRFGGRADLITIEGGSCAIIDYKTGAPNDHHKEQLRTYALLWSRDIDRNPGDLPISSLILVYPTHDENLPAPGGAELSAIADELTSRVEAAGARVSARPPIARPSADVCRVCSVRHLCETYWQEPPSAFDDSDGTFIDREGQVVGKNGPRSWLFDVAPQGDRVLLRTPTEDPEFRVGDSLRLLNVVTTSNEESEEVALHITQGSEIFHTDPLHS